MKKLFTLIMCLSIACFCVTGFAKEKTVMDYIPDFFDILPWDVTTGEYTDGRDLPKDGGENVEKNRQMEEDAKTKETQEETSVGDKEGAAAPVKSIDLIIILDKSGSMYNMVEDTIGGFNSMLEEQRKKEVPVKVSVGMFNQSLEAKYDRAALADVKQLSKEEYVPSGSTALLDAVGNTLSALKTRTEVNAEGNKVLVVIITDGMENASKEWTKENVKKLISELKEKGYEFVFLGADIDAVSVAQGMGIDAANSVKFKKTSAGVQANFKAINVMMEAVGSGSSLADDAKWKRSIIEDK